MPDTVGRPPSHDFKHFLSRPVQAYEVTGPGIDRTAVMDVLTGKEQGVHDVINIGEIPGLLAVTPDLKR